MLYEVETLKRIEEAFDVINDYTFDSEYNQDRVMEAQEFCDIYDCDDDILEDDDQLVYIDNLRDPHAWLVNIVKHIYERF